MNFDRTHIREHAKSFAQSEQSTLRAVLGVWVIPFGATHRAEEDRICRLAIGKSFIGEGGTIFINRTTTHQSFLILKSMVVLAGNYIQHADGFMNDVRSD